MRTTEEISTLIAELNHCVADDLESQDLDFKQWDMKTRKNATKTVVQMAVCMANGGGGTVVFGVADKIGGRDQAILGVPTELDFHQLKKSSV